jgi:protein-tyrosine phosphatase
LKKEEGIIDIHCHILPGFNDGPSSLEEAKSMLEEAKRIGVREIVATPHLKWGEHIYTREEIEASINVLPNFIKIYPGAEVPLLEAPQLLEEGKIISTGKIVLLDIPPIGGLIGLEQLVFKLALKHLTAIIAHPERNPSLIKDGGRLQHLKNMGALFQINAGSLLGIQGKEMRRLAEQLIEWGFADILASDAHNPEAFKYLKEAISLVAKRWGAERAKAMTKTNIEHLIRKEE